MNPMREVRIEKVTLNIGCASDKEKLERAVKLLEKITKQKPLVTRTHKRNTFGVAKKKPIGAKVTLRREKAKAFLSDVLKAIDKKIRSNQVNAGNFSIGIKEYIDLPNVDYDPDIGVIGMDVSITLERPGYRVKKRRIGKTKIGKNHIITKEETIEWIKGLGVDVVE
jgi:large subunit ribosomal protein L5